MKKIITIEYLRMRNSKGFKLAIIIGIIVSVAQAIHYNILGIETSYNNESLIPLVCWFTYLGRDIQLFYRSLFYALFPIIVNLPFAVCYFQDCKSGYDKQLLIGTTRKKYAISKYLVSVLSGGFVAVVPLCISLFLHMGFISTMVPNELCLQASPHIGVMFCDLFFERPFIYCMIMIFINFLIGSCMCGITLCYSLIARRKYSVYMFSFVVWMMEQSVLAKLELDTWCYANIASPIAERVYLLPCILVISVTLLITFTTFTRIASRKDVL